MADISPLGQVLEKVLDPIADLITRIAGGAADEIGLTLRDSVKVYREKRQYQLLEKMHSTVAVATSG
jgi:hypothetical protein